MTKFDLSNNAKQTNWYLPVSILTNSTIPLWKIEEDYIYSLSSKLQVNGNAYALARIKISNLETTEYHNSKVISNLMNIGFINDKSEYITLTPLQSAYLFDTVTGKVRSTNPEINYDFVINKEGKCALYIAADNQITSWEQVKGN